MFRRTRAASVALALTAGTAVLVTAPAYASADPSVEEVQIDPNPIVVGSSTVKATFTVVTAAAGKAELQIDAPGVSTPVSVQLTPAPSGQQTKWTGTADFATDVKPGLWSFQAVAKEGAAEKSKKGFFKVFKKSGVRDAEFDRFDVEPSRVREGRKVFVSGHLDVEGPGGSAFQKVEILFRADRSSRWEEVASDRTDRRGKFFEKFAPETSGWVKAVFDGRPGIRPAASDPERVSVSKKFRKNDSRIVGFDASDFVKRGKNLRFKGWLQAEDRFGDWDGYRAEVGLFYKSRNSGEWELVKEVRSSGSGKFTTSVKARKSGFWKASFEGDFKTSGSDSRTEFVRVKR